ncbi:hypothetical protein ACRALDRAFT_1079561 [Sodiomyces alcalophilus JCM 7366]|uniref:uncharacterized protein n=1 Tax=Sodiomyces alcalophilus JCM 7366 TaxID=591952 RepID=UPI0039B5DB13
MRWLLAAVAALPALVSSLASTDSYRDADIPQSGYLPNHNLDPNVVGSSSFRTLWEFQSPDPNELWLAKPLVYTPAGGPELLITSSEKNIIRIFDAKTGAILNQRLLQAPFSRDDSNCGDIPNWIGITGTPLIDPETDIMYLFSKGYREGTTSGTANGIYKMYALHVPSLEDAEGFPLLIDGANADNDPARYFVGGVALQRPALADMHGHIVAGFGSHCGRWNYTGYLLAVSKTPGVGVTSMWATEYPPGAPSPQPLDLALERGGKAGIWQSGFGLPVTGNSVFFVTGNGQGMHNGNVPASGRSPMSSLSHSTVRMDLSPDGKWSQVDYFQPYDYTSLNAGDRDVGSSGFALLDGSVFRGAGVDRMGVIAGKEGRAYVLNANELGGFRQGPGNFDNTIQTIELGGAVYGGFGSYPLEGGYIYVTTVGGPLKAFRMGHDADGKPVFSLAGESEWRSAGRVGVGQMTVTSDNGRPGTGIVWVTDVTVGLAAFRAVPEDGRMVQIPLPSGLRGSNKYQRPVFGDGRVYYQATTNRLYCLGTPVAQAVTCSDVDFGTVDLGSVTTATVSCRAEVAVSAVSNCAVSNPSFVCDPSTLPAGPLTPGSSFTVQVTWDLESASAGVVPGFVSSSLSLDIDAPDGYASVSVVALEGTIATQSPYLHATSTNIPFGRLILRDGAADHLEGSAVLENVGNSTLTITGVAWQDADGTYHNITESGDIGSGFTSTEFPEAGTTIATGGRESIHLRFASTTVAEYSALVTVWSDGGSLTLNLTAAVKNPPVVVFEASDGEGGWESLEPHYSVSFGDVAASSSSERQIRVCNTGGSALTITISKPPVDAQLLATNPSHDLAEGIQIEPDECSVGNVAVRASPIQPNHPIQPLQALWTLTTNGLNATSGEDAALRDIVFTARVVPQQLGPLLDDGTARFQYVGCFSDTSMGRNLQTQVNNAEQQQTNTIQQCHQLCMDRGFVIAGVQYRRECWCGGPPNYIRHPGSYSHPSENRCTFGCMGDDTQACGGNGGFMSVYADITAFDIEGFLDDINNDGEPSSSQPPPPPPSTTTTTTTTSAPVTESITPSSSSSAEESTLESTTAASSETSAPESTTTSSSSSEASVPESTSASSSSSSEASAPESTTTTSSSSSEASAPESISATSSSSSEASAPESTTTSETSTPASTSSTSSAPLPSGSIPVSPLNPKQPAVVNGEWEYAGCFADLVDGVRSLGGSKTASDDMTPWRCGEFCDNNGSPYNYFGLTYGRECFCGWTLDEDALRAPEADCPNSCAGSTDGLCGGFRKLSVFKNLEPNAPPAGPEHVPQVLDYQWMGCQTEATTGRALSGKSYASDDMSVDSCAAFCADDDFGYMGVEYGRECYCGNTINAGSVPAPTAECSMLCKGNTLQYCGAGSRLDLYSLVPGSGSPTSSAVEEPTSAVPSSEPPVSSEIVSSSEAAVTSDEVVPTSSLGASSIPSSEASSVTDPERNSPTSASSEPTSVHEPSSSAVESSAEEEPVSSTPVSSQSSFMSVPSVPASLSTPVFEPSTISTSTSQGPSATPTHGYYYVGCFQDVSSGHALPHMLSNHSVTPELCLEYAQQRAADAPTPTAAPAYVFVEYHHECYAGNTFDFQGSAVTSLVGTQACKNYCYGSVLTYTTDGTTSVTTKTDNYCGGPKMFDLYATELPVDFPTTGGPVTTVTTGTPRP